MDELKNFSNSAVGWGSAIAAALIGAAVYLPKIFNTIKSDRIDGNVLDRIKRHEERMDKMDKTIHRQQVRLTRLQVLVIQMNGLLAQNGVAVPEFMQAEIRELTAEGDESEAS
jgi:hypothetical protein